jgi:hypothetical protein
MRSGSQPTKLIGFDMDGVLIDHTGIRIELARRYGIELAPKDTPSDILRTVIPNEERWAIQNAIYNDPAMALEAPLMAGAEKGLEILSSAGIPFVLISRRKDPQLAIRLMEARGIWPRYFNERNTTFVITPEDKDRRSTELGITHYVDDEMKVLAALTTVPHKILFDPHGAHTDIPYILAGDWGALMDILTK